MVFPVSPVMLDRIDTYRDTLRAHSSPLMNFIEWRPTPEKNGDVLNDTAVRRCTSQCGSYRRIS